MSVKKQNIVDHEAEGQHCELELEVHVQEERTREESQNAAVNVILKGKEAGPEKCERKVVKETRVSLDVWQSASKNFVPTYLLVH